MDDGPTIGGVRQKVSANEYRFTVHALERCLERDISPVEIKEVILSGEIIEEYRQDKYGPSCLICGATKEGRVLHVLSAIEPVWIITAYPPTPEDWQAGFKKRRRKQ